MNNDATLDTQARPFKAWLAERLKENKRDAVDTLAKHLLEDQRIPRQGSRSMYLAHLRSKKYSTEDINALEVAWSEMLSQS